MKAFISYSHRDEAALDRLHTHLAMLRDEGAIDDWYDREILAGADIDDEIKAQLESCELFLALVSPDFLASKYCRNTELKRAVERHDAGEVTVVPIIIKPCDWPNSPLGRLKALPKDGEPISNWTNEDNAYLDVVNELRRLMDATSIAENSIKVESGAKSATARRYRAQRDFDEIDRADFREAAFQQLREYFDRSITEINSVDGLRGRFHDLGPTSFGCTVINQKKDRGTAHITVHTQSESLGFGDITFSFSENAPSNTANGWLAIDCDEYDLFLRFHNMQGFEQALRVSQQSTNELLWKEFIRNAGISHE